MDEVHRACGRGWKVLIDALIAECDREVVKVVQIKEKFGGLRFYTDALPKDSRWLEKDGSVLSVSLAQYIEAAETLSYIICETCGEPGDLSSNGQWLKTLCATHRYTLDYKTRTK